MAASLSASAMGFEVRHIRPAMPSQYGSRNDMLQALFGTRENQPIMIAMTAFEIALLLCNCVVLSPKTSKSILAPC